MVNKKIVAILSVVLVVGVFWIAFAQENLTTNTTRAVGKIAIF